MDELAFWKQKLKDKEIKFTKQRFAILKVLINSNRPLSAQEVFKKIKSKGDTLRLSTVYRNLNYFEEKNIIYRLNLYGKESRFELRVGREHHHHLVCVICSKVRALDCPLHNFEEKVSDKTDYQLFEHKIKLYGLCPRCKKNKERS
ncbi:MULTISPECIES: Fur family transcriptional regulator [unclassified Candidatus Frackibacter]|uniref:Fur family transcriptional regulator n=1 Tax=unclassified Candidatus Frackibacter TaxID=2648818 RepID=UPI00088B8EB1|nr:MULTISPECIES: transcriptional repressor [unclassified Candidatus Frackibacter]SDC18501.1 Fur family transcriptional regulator, ferric uptake regulator [Candidatus Frackibacter sp. WG11]SEM43760.1 Fur family transcriptional regulator, ferric uptake regulator [Candidatus Frackibacter sp. WG12]SFL46172.1 Fur family transcriptional regulator, ferric uptake regulator [Candidatus Frackibacter sp. WG13]